MLLPETIQIFRCLDNCYIDANLIQLTRDIAKHEIDPKWWQGIATSTNRKKELDHSWNWATLIGSAQGRLTFEAVGIRSEENEIEGALFMELDAKSQLEEANGAIYIVGISTAPRNRNWLVESPRYSGIGEVLILTAIRYSYSLGLKGRVWLEAFETPTLQRFYRKFHFEEVCRNEDGMTILEVPTEMAVSMLRQKGFLE